jgi:hypothetical protein
MKHFASPEFWECYRELPQEVRDLADKNFDLLKLNSRHPSLHLKKVGDFGRCGLDEIIVALQSRRMAI